MKKYEAPIVELTKFDVEDVITTSTAVIDVTTAVDPIDFAKYAADIQVAGDQNGVAASNVFSW